MTFGLCDIIDTFVFVYCLYLFSIDVFLFFLIK
jgi:hypothetical protein